MKKLYSIIFILILTGCSDDNFTVENPVSIVYNDNNIVENDFNDITSLINKISFTCGKQNNYSGNTLTIITNEQVYKFSISSNYYMEFQKNDKYCHTKDVEEVKNLVNTLDNLNKKYIDTNFYSIRKEEYYENNDKDLFIKLDKSNDYIIINSIESLNNFKINEIEIDDETNSYIDIDLLYSSDIFETNTNIIIRKEILHEPSFRICFTTKYNYLVTISPILTENNETNFITNIEKSS